MYSNLNRNKIQFWARKFGFTSTKRLLVSDLPKVAVLDRALSLGLNAAGIESLVNNPDDLRSFARLPVSIVNRVVNSAVGGRPDELIKAVVSEVRKLLRARSVYVIERFFSAAAGYTWKVRSADPDRAMTVDMKALSHELVPPDQAPDAPVRAIDATARMWVGSAVPVAFKTGRPSSEAPISVLLAPFESLGETRFWLVVEDKTDGHGMVHPALVPDPVDAELVEEVCRLFPTLWSISNLQSLIQKGVADGSLPTEMDVFRSLIEVALHVTGSFRGEVCIWDDHDRLMRVAASYGPTSAAEKLGSSFSISRWVLEHGEERYLPDVEKDDYYFQCSTYTRSEFAVPIFGLLGQRPVAVLNVESDRPDGFSEFQKRLIRNIAQIGFWIVERGATIKLLQAPVLDDDEHCSHFAECIRTEFGFDACIVYGADPSNGTLVLRAPAELSGSSFSLKYSDRSFATHAYRANEPYFTPDAANDLHANREALKRFSAEMPVPPETGLLAIPIRFGGVPIGVTVVWNRDFGRKPAERTLAEIVAFCSDFVSGVLGQRLARAASELDRLRKELAGPAPPKGEDLVGRMLECLTSLGFDRARVLLRDRRPEHKAAYRFVCLGENARDKAELGVREKHFVIDKCQHVVFEGIKTARRFDPVIPEFIDPNAEKLGKPGDLPYANRPLFEDALSEDCIGYIGCDNKFSRQRILAIDTFLLDSLAEIVQPHLARYFAELWKNPAWIKEVDRLYSSAAA